MNRERWQQVKKIFQQAAELRVAERAAFLLKACGGDAELRAEVESLLRCEEDSGNFLEESAARFLPDPLIGERLGSYELLRKLGEGGMGSVYLAERTGEFRQRVAIKLMRLGVESPAIAARFRRERQILAGLTHPNIARLLDGGVTEDGRPYFVMECVDGVPLDEYARAHALGVRERVALFRQVCAAVQYSHQNLIVHRDLKPGNILVTTEGVAKLLDFGIAKLMQPEAAEEEPAAMTQLGVRLLTPEYASPEQALGLPVATSSDVYSLGVILYELLTGRPPYAFPAASPAEVERVIREVQPRLPSVAAPANARQLAGDLDVIAMKALEKETAQRYASVEQLSADLQRHLDGVPIEARPHTFLYKANRFVRRNRIGVVAAALIVVSLVSGAGVALWQARRAERRFNEVRQLARAFLFDFHDSIKDLAGATPARKLIVEKARVYLDNLARESSGDPGLQRELAEAYLKVGDVQGNPYSSNLGDLEGAQQSYRRALIIAEGAGAPLYVARAHRSLGDLLLVQDELKDAVSHYRKAIDVSARLPLDAASKRELASTYEGLGDALGNPGTRNIGDYDAARQAYQKALALHQSLPAAEANPRAPAVLNMKFGNLEMERGTFVAALQRFQSAVDVVRKLRDAEPDNAANLRLDGILQGKLGHAMERRGNLSQALAHYSLAAQVQKRLMQADAANMQGLKSYAAALKNRADLQYKMGDAAGALAAYKEVLEMLEKRALAEPANTVLRSHWSEALVQVGGSLAGKQASQEEAIALYRKGLAMARELAGRPSANADDDYLYVEELLTCPFPTLAQPREAVRHAQLAVEKTKGNSANYLQQLARAYAAVNEFSNAVATQKRAVALLPESSAARKEAQDRLARFLYAQ